MSKRLHLICNAHIDPVWQWQWEEGAAEALSTFRIAAQFCEEYDGFVFCHNEALLYKWVEEYEPALFERIRLLVKQKKWHIMGGWFLQPDCNMPSGEAFIRQIAEGRKYFYKKFGVKPEVAVNVDPFGHDRGIVQIMVKCGYKGYLFMRPGDDFLSLPANEFRWKGFDGSEVTAVRIEEGYNSGKGRSTEKILKFLDNCPDNDIGFCMWGVGNHGGGPSKKDLDDITELNKRLSATGDVLIHSTPEMYINEVSERRDLPMFDKALRPWGIGCYTSQIRIKQKYRAAENEFFMTELMASHAAVNGLCDYPEKELYEALYDILFVQFHDILPGSSIQPAEEMALRMLDHALEILSRTKTRVFFALSAGQPKAPDDKIPIFVYNPYPYEITSDISSEFMLWDQVWEPGFMRPTLFDASGKQLPVQCEKEYSTVPLEWRKRVVFNATLAPMSINRFLCGFDLIPKRPVPTLAEDGKYFVSERGGLRVLINRDTGLIDSVIKDGREYVIPSSFSLQVYNDNFDPWFMTGRTLGTQTGEFRLLTPEQTQEFCCTDTPIEAVRVIEGGDVRSVVEAVFGFNSSRAVVKYILSNDGTLRTDIRIVWNEKQKLVRLNVASALSDCSAYGEQIFGLEKLNDNSEENVSQKYIMLCNKNNAILAVNNGIYGSMFDKQRSILGLTLLRSPSYCAHPLPERITMPQNRFMPYIEQGERDFEFLFQFGDRKTVSERAARTAMHFNSAPFSLSFYPSGVGEVPAIPLNLKSDIICLTAFKKADDGNGYIARIFNPTEKECSADLSFLNISKSLYFGKFEVKTLRCTEAGITETDMLEGIFN